MVRNIATASFLLVVPACATSSAPPGGGGDVHFDSGGTSFDGSFTEDSGSADGGSTDGRGGGSDSGTNDMDSGGSLTDSGGGPDGVAAGCTWSVSGGATASGTCIVDVAFSGGTKNQLAIALTDGTGLFSFSAQLAMTASFVAGTWTYADVSIAGAVYVVIPVAWDMSKGNTSGTTAQGDFTLTITQPGPEVMLDGSDLWASPHGTLTVTMPPSHGNSSTTNVIGQATF